MQSGLANEYRMALGTQGRLLLPITSSASFLGLVEVVAVNPQTNTPEPHNMGMALFHISAGAPRCIPFPVDANALPDTITGVIPFVYPEGGQLGSNPNAAGRVGVDTHILFGFLAPEASGVRTCVLPGFQNNPTTNLNNYPGLTLSMPSIAGLPAIFAINQPGFTFAPFSVSPVEQVANIPLRHLDKGQRFVPNALRMSDALITQAQQSPGRAYLQMDISFTDQAMTQTLTLTSIGIDTGIGAAR